MGICGVPIPVTAPETGPSTATKMTAPSTAKEKTCKKNDVKARTLSKKVPIRELEGRSSLRNNTADMIIQSSLKKTVKIEDAPEKAMCAIDGVGFDWSDRKSLEEFKEPEVNEYGPRDSSLKPTTGCDKESDNSKENTDDSLKQQQKTDSKTSSVNSTLRMMMMKWSISLRLKEKTVIKTYSTNEEFVKLKNSVRRLVSCPKTSFPSTHKHMAPKAVLMKDGPKKLLVCLGGALILFSQFTAKLIKACDSGFLKSHDWKQAQAFIFQNFDEVNLLFGEGAYGGRITGKCTIKTNNLDFDDVYFVKELKFNLFSVSQMCDKKNYVLFTDSECLVLSPNFKLPDENQILLKIPRQDNNKYLFDMKNIVPKDSI
ncbi:hypothetical protein Tco_0867787 [Tanacetum coccineum]